MVGTDAGACSQPHLAAFRSPQGHGAALAPRHLISLSARWPGSGLPVLDDLWVITADNEIFSHRLYYRGWGGVALSQAGSRCCSFRAVLPLLTGLVLVRTGRARWSPRSGRWMKVVVVTAIVCPQAVPCRGRAAPLQGIAGGLLWGQGGLRPSLGDMGYFCPGALSPVSPEM